jgi:glycosyltransferase involved in cell wall biosynthesis
MGILARVHERVPDLETIIVGEGTERSGLEARLRELGADGYVSMPGRLGTDQLVELYRRAWVVVSTSVREGWGMTVSEAAACGTPAVATRIPGHLDAIEHGVTGMLTDRDDDFARHLETLLCDPLLRRRLGRAASERVTALTWEATARGTLAALVADARSRSLRGGSRSPA